MPWQEPFYYGQRGEIRKRYREGRKISWVRWVW